MVLKSLLIISLVMATSSRSIKLVTRLLVLIIRSHQSKQGRPYKMTIMVLSFLLVRKRNSHRFTHISRLMIMSSFRSTKDSNVTIIPQTKCAKNRAIRNCLESIQTTSLLTSISMATARSTDMMKESFIKCSLYD